MYQTKMSFRQRLLAFAGALILHGVVLYGLWGYKVTQGHQQEPGVFAVNLVASLEMAQPERQPAPVRVARSAVPEHAAVKLPRPPMPDTAEVPEAAVNTVQAVMVETAGQVSQVQEAIVPEAGNVPPISYEPIRLSGELGIVCPDRSPPDYPWVSRRMNEQGKVLLRVELGEDGRVLDSAIEASSGHRRLDDAALSAVRAWHCNPSMRNGVAVRTVAMQPFNFMLE